MQTTGIKSLSPVHLEKFLQTPLENTARLMANHNPLSVILEYFSLKTHEIGAVAKCPHQLRKNLSAWIQQNIGYWRRGHNKWVWSTNTLKFHESLEYQLGFGNFGRFAYLGLKPTIMQTIVHFYHWEPIQCPNFTTVNTSVESFKCFTSSLTSEESGANVMRPSASKFPSCKVVG